MVSQKKGARLKDMTTITLKVSEADKSLMQAIAKFEGVSLSRINSLPKL